MAIRPRTLVLPRNCLCRRTHAKFISTSSQKRSEFPTNHRARELIDLVGRPPRPTSERRESTFQPQRSKSSYDDTQLQALVEQAGRPVVKPQSQPSTDEVDEDQLNPGVAESFLKKTFSRGELYSPKDLSPGQMSRYQNRSHPRYDRFDLLGINPLKEYKNFALLNEFTTEGGSILRRKITGLRPVNQRRLAKAIRRAVGLGILPSVYKHPEILDADSRSKDVSLLQRYTK